MKVFSYLPAYGQFSEISPYDMSKDVYLMQDRVIPPAVVSTHILVYNDTKDQIVSRIPVDSLSTYFGPN